MDFTRALLVGLILTMFSVSIMLLTKVDTIHTKIDSVNNNTLSLQGTVKVIDTKTIYIQKEVERVNANLTEHVRQSRAVLKELTKHKTIREH